MRDKGSRDDEKQAQAVRKVLLDAEIKADILFVPIASTLEIIWMLSSVYEYCREEILQAQESLLILSVLRAEEHERIASLCRIAPENDVDLADLLIGLTSRDKECETTLSFDKKAARSELFTLNK